MRTLLRDVEAVFPDGVHRMNILLEDEKIASLDAPASSRADTIVNAGGLHLMPGVIDDQVHFRDPGLTHKEDLRTGSRACAKGGITTFLEMPNTQPTTTTVDALHTKLADAATKCIVDFGFYIGATPHNVDELRRAERTPGIKIFIGSSTGDLLVDEQAALERIFAETHLPITAHCEDEATIRANAATIGATSDVRDHSRIRDEAAALRATARAIELSRKYEHPFHVLHVSTAAELELLDAAPPWVTSEVCPHHLFFHTEDYERLGTRVQCNPSIKSKADNEGLWEGLLAGRIDILATDHAPHTLEEKAKPYPSSPSGMPSVENFLPLLLNQVHEGKCTLPQLVQWMCAGPARIWSIARKGHLREGYDADLVLVDLNRRQTILDEHQESKCGWSPWHGTTLYGWPLRTWVRGREVFSHGTLIHEPWGKEATFERP